MDLMRKVICIHNEINTRGIELLEIGRELQHLPAIEWTINLATEEIQPQFNRSIWIAVDDLASFITDLNALTKSGWDGKTSKHGAGRISVGF